MQVAATKVSLAALPPFKLKPVLKHTSGGTGRARGSLSSSF